MGYRSILVCLDGSKRSVERLQLALDLAKAYDAHITGLYLYYMPFDPKTAYGGSTPLIVKYQQEQTLHELRVRNVFFAASKDTGVIHDWVSAPSLELKAAIAFARTADLVVAGQYDPDDSETYMGDNFPDRLILSVGRPTLIIPHSGALPTTFKQIAIAWNGSRESARAVADALPFLKRAENIKVFIVSGATEQNLGETSVPKPDISVYLQRHNIKAEVIESTGIIDTGEWMLARATGIDMMADLFVAGAYGHSRLSELILGGVTRTLLREMTIPVLMSH